MKSSEMMLMPSQNKNSLHYNFRASNPTSTKQTIFIVQKTTTLSMIGSRAWWALMRRNLIYRKRNLVGTFFELALPVAFVAIVVAIKNAVKNSEGFQTETINATFPEIAYKPLSFRDYVTAMRATHKCVQGMNPQTGQLDFWITGVPQQGANWTVPFVKCDSRGCTQDGEDATELCEFGIIGVSGSDLNDMGGRSRADDFTTWLYEEYPELSTNMPFTYKIVKKFNASHEMTDYVKDKNYGKATMPKLVMGIVFEGNGPFDYKYALRQNSTNFNSPESEWRPAVLTTPDTDRLFKDYAKDDKDVCGFGDGEAQQGWLEESCTGRYLYNGVLTFQRLVGDFILSDSGAVENGYRVAESGVSFSSFPTFAYVESGFFGDIGEMLALLVVLGLLYPVAAMISCITREKEKGQKELMKMMSAVESDIGWSWFASFLLFNIFTATIVSAVSMALFVKSEGLLLWTFWIFTFLAITVFCMFLATLTSKATRAVVIGLLIFFIGLFLSFAVNVDDGSRTLIGLISLHPVGALSYGLQVIGTLEDQDIGLQGNTVGSADTSSGWTVENSLQFFLIDSLIYGFLTWYLNRTIKPDYGQSLPLWFPFTRAYWLPHSVHHHPGDSDMVEEENHSSVPFELVDRRTGEEGDDIVIRNLRMAFGKKHAVDGLSLTMYNGHVTALLGHNGAGKTTTIKLLTGALSPTGGSATIAGKSIRADMGEIRENIGLCPQENCLFDVLTVRETVQFFARLKGVYSKMSVEEANAHVDQAIQDIALAEKCNTLAKNLSGGMKRKLSVAIAFCGESKTVFLDEPTSGMDPFSRRFTWDVIRQYRENRTIILTTHFMDEADILGDRIAIMAEGQLRCVGSPLFLKKTYGVGYQLTIEKGASNEKCREADEVQTNTAADYHQTDAMLRDIVKSAVPEATRLSNSSVEMRYQLPIASSSSFVPMFDALDEAVNRGEISSYGVSITTLDEVFLAVAQGDTREKNEFASSVMNIDNRTVQSEEDRSTHSTHSAMNLEKEGLFARHMSALLYKRAANFKRDKRAWLCTTILPSLFVLVGFVVAAYAGVNKNLDPILLTLDDYNIGANLAPRNPIVYNSPGAYACQPEMCAYHIPTMNSTTNPGTGELYHFCGEQARLNDTENCTITESTDLMNGINDAGAFPVETDVDSLVNSSHSLYATWNSFAASQYGAIFFTHDTKSVTPSLQYYNDAVYDACLDNVDNYTTVEQCLHFSGIGYVVQYNYTALHVAPLLQVLADEALNNPAFNIECTLDPLPVTLAEETYGKAEDTFLAWFLIVVSFPFIAGAFGTFVVSERQSKAKHLQTVAGVKPHAYWLSTWLWDVANYEIPFCITVALMFAFDVEAMTTTSRGVVGGVITLLFLFGPAAASFTYCVSFAFESPAMCNLFIIISGFLIGMGGPIAVWILHVIGEGGDRNDPNETLLDAANIVTWVLRFFPTFCLGNGINNAIYIQALEYWEGEHLTVWTKPVLLIEVLYLAGEAVVYLALAVLLDKWSTNPRMVSIGRKIKHFLTCQCFCHQASRVEDITVALPDDDDVLAEQTRVLEGGANNDLIVLSEITKIYGTGKKAVSNFSIGIASGECFGLLGINGAGKTTTLQILTAEFPPTSGDATLAGYSVTKEPEKTRRRIGYCPQFDAHFENMTGREHVELYASIKGVPKDRVKASAAACLAEVGLSPEDCDRLSSHYSGGMKRRLSLACALIGQPQIVFLDECTTGVDPVARREIWQVISNMVTQVHNDKKPAVIMTTHSMEECEALCPRIGIMANGRLRCLGSAQHLKNRFGKGFQVELKVDVIDKTDTDYLRNLGILAAYKGITEAEEEPNEAERVYFSLTEVQEALRALTNDSYLSDMVEAKNPVGFGIWRDATSVTGCSWEELAAFCTCELRLRQVEEFMKTNYPGFVLRERQDSKVRYEVPSENVRISSIFASIEDNKARLRLSDYGVSQTSLEQVFNMHAAEAERLKQGRIDD